MVDRKTNPTQPVRGQAMRASPSPSAQTDARVVHHKLTAKVELTIDDSDFGTDPYNRTGRFTVLEKD